MFTSILVKHAANHPKEYHGKTTDYLYYGKQHNGTLYVGVTSDLVKRVYQHKNSAVPGFSRRYGCKLLVYYDTHEDMLGAITREKQIKGGSRKRKITLIESVNPEWNDLYSEIL